MSQNVAPQGSGTHPGGATARDPADVAYRRAWWSLALYPVALVAAFGIGEGLITMLSGDAGDPGFWEVLAAGAPALLVFAIPGVLAVTQGRKARRLGRPDGRTPAVVGALIAIVFVAQNVLTYVLGLLVG